jgi:hypothetical protein
MGFITQFWAKNLNLKPWFITPALVFVVACTQAETNFGFQLEEVQTHSASGMLNVSVHQKMKLSREAREALRYGVPLTIQTELVLRDGVTNRKLKQTHQEFEIRFLPLSNRYQLTRFEPLKVSTFPRLRHALAKLATVEFRIPHSEINLDGMEISARSFLEKQRMPPPMRLPAWFSPQWRHDSGWLSKPVDSQSGV